LHSKERKKFMKNIKKSALITLSLLTCVSFAQFEQSRLYTGLRLGGSVGMVFPVGDEFRAFFNNDDPDAPKWWNGGSFDAAPFVSWQFTNTFALHTEFMFTRFGYYGEKYQYDDITEKFMISRRAMMVPLLVKYTRRQDNTSFQFFIGPHFTYNFGRWRWHYRLQENGSVFNAPQNTPWTNSINEHIRYPALGITLGTNFGFITTKAGTIFADARFSQDLGHIKTGEENDDGTITWTPYLLRGKLSFSLGYEFGFVKR